MQYFQGSHIDDNKSVKVIPQKLRLQMNFFETFPEYSLPSTVSKKTIKMIGHHARLRDVTGQSYTIYACARVNHTRYSSVQVIICGSWKHDYLSNTWEKT